MKRMPNKQFKKLIQRLMAKGFYVTTPHRRGRRGWTNWAISRNFSWRQSNNRITGIEASTQEEFIHWARYLLDGGPRPQKVR